MKKIMCMSLSVLFLLPLGIFGDENPQNKKSIHEITVKQHRKKVSDIKKWKKREVAVDNLKPDLLSVSIERNIVIRKVTISKFEQIQTLRDFGIEVPAMLENVKIDEFEHQKIPLKLTKKQIELLNRAGIQTEKMPIPPKSHYKNPKNIKKKWRIR